MKGGVVYKTINRYDPSKYKFITLLHLCMSSARFIWFMSDICHLIKTTRNCWESSSKNGARHLQVYAHNLTDLTSSIG
jgi:hypothetical protein